MPDRGEGGFCLTRPRSPVVDGSFVTVGLYVNDSLHSPLSPLCSFTLWFYIIVLGVLHTPRLFSPVL
jgi:hypothetical protein